MCFDENLQTNDWSDIVQHIDAYLDYLHDQVKSDVSMAIVSHSDSALVCF